MGLNVGDVYFPDGRVKARIRLRAEIAKGGRAGDVFLPAALTRKLETFWAYKLGRRERLDPPSPLFCNQGRRRISKRRVQVVFRAWQVHCRIRAALRLPHASAYRDNFGLPRLTRPIPRPAVREACESTHNHDLHACE